MKYDTITAKERRQSFMKAIITVVGTDRVGIIGSVCTYLAEENINILDISQTIQSDFFNMLMVVDISAVIDHFDTLQKTLKAHGHEIGVEISMQREEIFSSMHRL